MLSDELLDRLSDGLSVGLFVGLSRVLDVLARQSFRFSFSSMLKYNRLPILTVLPIHM